MVGFSAAGMEGRWGEEGMSCKTFQVEFHILSTFRVQNAPHSNKFAIIAMIEDTTPCRPAAAGEDRARAGGAGAEGPQAQPHQVHPQRGPGHFHGEILALYNAGRSRC